ncbi:MAG: hypothetical protein PHG75_06625 [Syntrophomonas sp.]|nr:hypothetical protein [Syntrophomonas sp.]
MKKSILIISVLGWLAMMAGLGSAAQAAQDNPGQWAGIYDIIINTSDQQQVPTTIDIRDLGNGQMEVTATLEDQSVIQPGEYRGDPEGEGLQAHFDINQFGLVKGSADFTIRRVDKTYQIQGQAVVNSLMTGQLGGDFSGQRRGGVPTASTPIPSSPEKSAPERTTAPAYTTWIAAAVGMLVLAILIKSRSKRSSR